MRRGVEAILGWAVVQADTQPSGFSPGVAVRVGLANGRRAFVKAVGALPNPEALQMHRDEARILAHLPVTAPVPRLLGVHDQRDWVALVLEEVVGTHPQLPWRPEDVGRVVAALSKLQRQFTPCPLPDLPTAVERHRSTFDGWRRLRQHRRVRLPPWAERNLDRLAEREPRWEAGLAGETLLHGDLRADNLLLTESGSVVFLDWPWASRGVDWFDPLILAPSVAMQGGPAVDWIIARHAGARAADHEVVTDLLVAVAGYFFSRAQLPAPPGLPTLRQFQLGQGRPTLDWLKQRTGWD